MAVTKSGKIDGRKTILKNLRREIAAIEGDILVGLKKAAVLVEEEAVDRAPIEFGTLRDSSFTTSARLPEDRSIAVIGFTAKYAPFVHEMPMKLKGQPRTGKNSKGVYWQDGENKFLEKAVVQNVRQIIDIVAKNARR